MPMRTCASMHAFPYFSEGRGVLIDHPQKINVGYAKFFTTCSFISACHRWNEKDTADKMWANFKVHFSAAQRKHSQMKGNQPPIASNAAV
jgi:hypothetical protein